MRWCDGRGGGDRRSYIMLVLIWAGYFCILQWLTRCIESGMLRLLIDFVASQVTLPGRLLIGSIEV